MKLTEEEIKEILKNEAEIFNGDRRAACASHIHTIGVVMKVGFKEPSFSNKQLVTSLKTQVTKYETEQNANKTKDSKNVSDQTAGEQTASAQTGSDQTATGEPAAEQTNGGKAKGGKAKGGKKTATE